MTSYNPNDIREGYCGSCHDWTGVVTSPCHVTMYVHRPHLWTPIIADPENDHVLYLSGLQVRCPGVP